MVKDTKIEETGRRNGTELTEFILLGFPEHPKLQLTLLVTFLVIYIITLVANIDMILLI